MHCGTPISLHKGTCCDATNLYVEVAKLDLASPTADELERKETDVDLSYLHFVSSQPKINSVIVSSTSSVRSRPRQASCHSDTVEARTWYYLQPVLTRVL